MHGRLDDRATAIAAAHDDLELAVRLMRRLQARLEDLLVEPAQGVAGDRPAVGAAMPERGFGAGAGVDEERRP